MLHSYSRPEHTKLWRAPYCMCLGFYKSQRESGRKEQRDDKELRGILSKIPNKDDHAYYLEQKKNMQV